jgi:hypothetical protein
VLKPLSNTERKKEKLASKNLYLSTVGFDRNSGMQIETCAENHFEHWLDWQNSKDAVRFRRLKSVSSKSRLSRRLVPP